jgi:lipid-binding SYLF domain-containing protein
MIKKVILAVCVLVVFAGHAFAQDKWENLLIESAKVFEEMTEMPEDGIPENLIDDAHAVAIFPSVVGGGFVVGGKYGQGVIVAKDAGTGKLSAPAVFNIAGASFGWQIGGQATDVILLIMTERGLDGILASNFKLGGDASVAAGPVGREAAAATDLQLKGGILSYSRSRGAFIGLKLEGAVISFNKEANASLYEDGITARNVLIDQSVDYPEYSQRLMDNLKKYGK